MKDSTRQVEVREYRFEDDGSIPNNPTLPLLIYPRALPEGGQDPSRCKELLAQNGWGGAWVGGVFSYHHYHSTSHEVLCVVGGEARITFGGPGGETAEVAAGDVVVIPAGVGHCNEGSSRGFSVVGAYPRGQENYDLRTGEEGERPGVLENIRGVPLPETDPLTGEEGPLLRRWDP
ncbi:MAG: Cupin domain-containing protein [uncultured Rubrobacteraceae bacterium]|uniref:Cupin domain-containing protein n=1 Tax=uncultured Rubrobacteraceae bacterium TaxID=349277 RepID=A0A6J4QW63_9ACTN|nr:MAG: Cupin domain-containing protein [uncultured Rubrobacteraceae bacterium]